MKGKGNVYCRFNEDAENLKLHGEDMVGYEQTRY